MSQPPGLYRQRPTENSAVKVLDVTDFYSDRGGGIRSHLSAKGRILAAAGIDHVVIAPGPADSEVRLDDGASGRARILRVHGWPQPYDPNYRFLNRVGRVRELIVREQPDVLEINSPYLAALAALTLGKEIQSVKTWLWHSDHIDTHLTPRLGDRIGVRGALRLTRPFWSLLCRVALRCDATLVASQWESDKLIGHGFPRVVRLPFGVDKDVFQPGARSEQRRRELLGNSPADSALLIAVGRLSTEKHWDVVIEAFKRVRQDRRAVLVIYGDGPERARITELARGRDDVRLLGYEPDPRRLASALASSDVLVHACPYETFGLGVAEAVSAGLPVVVPDQGGAREHADGASAERYPARSGPACAAALARLLARDRTLVRAAALDAAERLLSVKQQFVATVDLYRRLLAERDVRQSGGACSGSI